MATSFFTSARKHSPVALAVLIGMTGFTGHAVAAGFQVSESSATGLGRAFAGDAAIADNASVLAKNPAGMTKIKSTQVSGALSYINPEVDVTDNTDYSVVGGNSYNKYSNIAPSQFVPASYIVSPINEDWYWGLGIFSNYGFATDFPDSAAAGPQAGFSEILTINFNPSLAYQVNEHLSLGAGFNVIYADAELKRRLGYAGDLIGQPAGNEAIKLKGDDFGYGWNVGALIEIDENNRFGISYRSKVKLNFDGDVYDRTGAATFNPGSKVDAKLRLDLPDMLEIAGFHQLNDQWAVHYSYNWTNWSRFEQILATSDACVANECLQKSESYHDSSRYSIGATYTYDPKWTFRAGFAFDEQAGATTISIPDTDRYWYSVGSTYNWAENLSLDFAFTYLDSKTQHFSEDLGLQNEGEFKSEGPAYLFATQVNYTF